MNDENLTTIVSMGGISILAAASRTVLSEDKRTLIGFMRGLVLAAFVGTITGLIIQHYAFEASTQGAIVGIAAFVADDILMMILSLVVVLRNKPEKVLDWVLKR